MDDQDWLADRFEANRSHLRGVAFRMLGSLAEADDAVQEAWIRLSRTDTSDVDNLRAWLTTVVGRVCLNMLRSRRTRREAPLDTHVPDPIASPEAGADPEHAALLGESLGMATSSGCWRCWIRRSCSAPTAAPRVRTWCRWFAEQRPSPRGLCRSGDWPRRLREPWSTGSLEVSLGLRTAARSPSCRSRSQAV